MQEEWRPVVGYEGLYEVSNLGRVRNIGFYTHYIVRGTAATKYIKPCTLNPTVGKNGYCFVCLTKNCIRTRCMVHRLVATAFIPNPLKKMTVNHINGIRTDNVLTNLEWATYYENTHHAMRTGLFDLRKPVIKMKNGSVVCEYESIKVAGEAINEELKENGLPISNCPDSNISACIKGRTKHAYGYQWKFKEKEPE